MNSRGRLLAALVKRRTLFTIEGYSTECTRIWPGGRQHGEQSVLRLSLEVKRRCKRTDSTTFGLHGVTLESPMLNQSRPLRTKAVLRAGARSSKTAPLAKTGRDNSLVTAAQVAIMVRHSEEVIHVPVRRSSADRLPALVEEGRRDETGQVETGQRVLHLRLELGTGGRA